MLRNPTRAYGYMDFFWNKGLLGESVSLVWHWMDWSWQSNAQWCLLGWIMITGKGWLMAICFCWSVMFVWMDQDQERLSDGNMLLLKRPLTAGLLLSSSLLQDIGPGCSLHCLSNKINFAAHTLHSHLSKEHSCRKIWAKVYFSVQHKWK